ncbi:MAG: RluA family pseudouridine synthase [Bacteroidota bacterium]
MVEPSIVYEDNHLLILHKPAGWLVQGDKTGDLTLTDWGREYIRQRYNKPGEAFLHPAHRLDRPVSGLVICCRTSKSLERMTRAFREDQIQKVYLAIVEGSPEAMKGTLTHWLWKDKAKNRVIAYTQPKGDAKKSELSYSLEASVGGNALLLVKPKTGRPHQIRVQLSKMQCPIVGDLKYGSEKGLRNKNIGLHAFQLIFTHPVKKIEMRLTCRPDTAEWGVFKERIDELDR